MQQPGMAATEYLQGLSENGRPPETRIKSASATRNLYQRAWDASDKRRARNALVKGMVDGNRPFDQVEITKNGQRYRANFNNGEAEAYLNSSVTAFYDLFSEVETRATVRYESELPEAVEWGDIVTREFQALLDKDDSFDWSIQCSIGDMVLYGKGPQIWEDPICWRAKRWFHDDLLIPDGSPSNVSDWERCFLKCDYRVDELYRYIADEKAAADAGWNVGAVRSAIMQAAKSVPKTFRANDWNAHQQWIRDNEMAVGDMCDVVHCARFLCKEFPGKDGRAKISEAWVCLDNEEDEFLYQETGVYDDFKQVLCAFFYDRGDGSAHSVRGLGVKMFHLLMAKMRLQNSAVDAAFVRASVTFRNTRTGEAARAQTGIVSTGPFSIVPPELEYVPIQSSGIIDAPLAVGRDLDGTLAANLGQYRARLEKPEGNPRTAFEVSAELQKQSVLGKTQIARYYQQLDEFYSEIFRRASLPNQSKTNYWQKLALAFQEACLAQGVPAEVLPLAKVTATRSVGQGSAYMRALSLGQTFAELYPALPEDGKEKLVNDVIAQRHGRNQVSRYNPKPEQRTFESGQRWEAQVENDTLRNRGNVLVAPYHNDVIHLQEHLAFASQAAQSLQAGANPAEILSVLQAAGQHSAMHLQRLSMNPMRKVEFKALEAQFNQLAKVTDQIEEQVQSGIEQNVMAQQAQQQAASIQNGSDPDTQIKWAESQQKAAINRFKAEEQVKLKQDKQQADMAMKDARTAMDIRTKAIKDQQAIRATAVKNAQAVSQSKNKA